jgi:hypothetical protein
MAGRENKPQQVVAYLLVGVVDRCGRRRLELLLDLAGEIPSLRACSARRRSWSIARCFAVAMSQAAGLSGTPETGHCSSADTSASCASSSARPTSRMTRARLAMRRGDSMRQTASMARWVSVAVTATDQITTAAAAQLPPVSTTRPLA